MRARGYTLSGRSKYHYALDSFVYEYQNAGGMRDNLKIEINYMLRCHILDLSRREVKLPWLSQELTVLCVDPIEIFASKIVALMNRAAPRDLYDFHNMIRFGLFDERELELLRKSVVYYSAIGSDEIPTSFSFDSIRAITQNRIKTASASFAGKVGRGRFHPPAGSGCQNERSLSSPGGCLSGRIASPGTNPGRARVHPRAGL